MCYCWQSCYWFCSLEMSLKSAILKLSPALPNRAIFCTTVVSSSSCGEWETKAVVRSKLYMTGSTGCRSLGNDTLRRNYDGPFILVSSYTASMNP